MSERPRVLLCSFEIYPGPTGGSRRLSAYLPALSERFDVVALTVKSPELSHIERLGEARLLRVPVSSDLLTRVQTFERAVRRQLQSESYALVHFTGPFGGYPLCEEREKHGYRLLYEALGFPSQELASQHPELEKDRRLLARFRRQELFCLMNADRVLTGSEVTRSFVRTLGVAQEAVQVLRAPAERIRELPTPPGDRPEGSLHLLYVGNQAPYQGLPTLLRGVAAARERAEVHLKIVGPRHPDWHPQLQELAAELQISDRVELLPPVPASGWEGLLAQADVGVLPLEDGERNREQGGPLAKASDYLGAGRPVLAADLPLTRELLPPHGTVFFPPGDAAALGDRLVELAHDGQRQRALGQASLAFARAELDVARIRARLLAVYDELVGVDPGRTARPARPLGPKDVTKALPIPEEPIDKDPTDPESRPPENRPLPPIAAAPRELPRAPPPRLSAVAPPRLTAAPSEALPAAAPRPPPALPHRPPTAPAPRTTPAAPGAAATPPRLEPARAPTPPPALPPSPPSRTPPERFQAPGPPPVRTPPEHAQAPAPPRLRTPAPPPTADVLPSPEDLEEISSDELLDAEAELDSTEAAIDALGEEPAQEPVHEVDDFEPVDEEVDEAEAVEEQEAIEEILEADAAVDVPPTIPGGLVDPWLSQILFGYCPPESIHFARPTPPTNFPGREQPDAGHTTSGPGSSVDSAKRTPGQPLSKPAGV